MPYRSVFSAAAAAAVVLLATGFTGVSAEAASVTFGRLGVHAGPGKRPDTIDHLTELGARWGRLNISLDGASPDFKSFLDAGVNVVITFNNADPTNADGTYGTPAQWPNAGFPYKSKAVYQQRIRDTLTPLLPYLAVGRQIWIQCENEVGDAAIAPNGRYWRGTTDQYLAQLQAFYEAARALHPALVVVMTSFASESLDVAINPANPKYAYETTRMIRLLTEGQYDAADPHFYGCVQDIPTKLQWLKGRLPAGRRWISTEMGGPDSRCSGTPITWTQNPTLFEQNQALQVAPRLTACAENGGSLCLWFSLFDLQGETEVFSHLGLLDSAVLPARRKPAYDAFKALTETLQLRVNGDGARTLTAANPVSVDYTIRRGQSQEFFLVLTAPALGVPTMSYLNAAAQWIPLPANLANVTPYGSAPADGDYNLYRDNLPAGAYDLCLGFDVTANGRLDIEAAVYDCVTVTVR